MTIRRLIVVAGASAGTLAILYAVAWFAIADQFRSSIDRWVADRRADGWTVEHGAIAIVGFPLSWHAQIQTPLLSQSVRKPAFRWSGPWIELKWRPWQSDIVDVRSSGGHLMGLGTAEKLRPIPLAMADGRGRLTFGARGHLQKLVLQVNGAVIDIADRQTIRIDHFAGTLDAAPLISSARQDATRKSHLKPAFHFDAQLFGLTLPEASRPALGRTIGKVAVRGALLGKISPGTARQAASAWRDGGGTLEVEHLELGWADLVVQAGGTMALDSTLQPMAAMTAKIAGYSETMDRLVAAGLVKPGAALLAKFALGAMARAPRNGGRPEIEVPLSVQEGWLFVGPVKLVPAPRIRWN